MNAQHQAAGRLRPALLAKLIMVIDREAPARRAAYIAGELVNLDAPETRQRGRPKGTSDWMLATGRYPTEDLAEVICAACLRVWTHSDRPPSMLTAARSIGAQLHAEEEKRANVGFALLRFAELAGVIAPIRKHWQTQRLELSEETLADLGALYGAAYRLELADGEGLQTTPSTEPPAVRRKWDQRDAPFAPRAGTSPQDAAAAVHGTQWQVDPQMRRVVETVLAERAPIAFGAKGSAPERRQMLHDYGSALYALVQATDGPQRGYFPVRWDHRGRLHQVGGALTYTGGSDAARAMLEFAEAKPVTDAGRPWLARHLINQYSSEEARKVPLGGELEWIKAHRELIALTATRPLAVRDWEKADAKHQFRFVAACRAWIAQEDGQQIRLPVAIDATTSVLQHIALLLRDPDLAALVNLAPGERRDFYQAVADARECSRSDVKKIAMTTFYGQTLRAAADGLTGDNRWTRARAIKAAAVRIAPRAYALHDALRHVAGELTRLEAPIRWETPSGWRCVTDRRERVKVRREARLPDGTSARYTDVVIGEGLDGRRQRNAITANLVQSLDAALLHLAVAALPSTVRSIAVAHDSFATHADDVPALRAALMGALEQMYARDDVLARVWGRWTEEGVTEPLPERGAWDDRFLQSAYTFC